MQWIGLLGFLVLVFAVAAFGAQFRPGPWYEGLAKPPWTPPNWIFGPVWSVLYAFIAVAGWRVWRRSATWTSLLGLWAVQLALNGAWSWLFFGRRLIDVALGDIVLLWFAILAFAIGAWRVDRVASYLFMPYLLWVSYALTLNSAISWLNR